MQRKLKTTMLMKTKDLFRGAMMSLCAVVMATMMSCNLTNRNNPDNPSTNPKDTTATSDSYQGAYAQYAYAATDDMIDLFYVKIEYLDGDGKMQTVTLTEPSWAKRVDAKSLPAKFGMRVNITMKGMADQTKYKSIALNYTASYISMLKDANGKTVGTVHKNVFDADKTIAPNELSEWVVNYQKKPVQFWFEYDAKGNFKLSE